MNSLKRIPFHLLIIDAVKFSEILPFGILACGELGPQPIFFEKKVVTPQNLCLASNQPFDWRLRESMAAAS